jgi:hypothetical protein
VERRDDITELPQDEPKARRVRAARDEARDLATGCEQLMTADEALYTLWQLHGTRVDVRGIEGSRARVDSECVTNFFHAWRRREADLQAAGWLEERTTARLAVAEVPPEIRDDVRRVVDTLLEGADADVEPALQELWNLLDDHPELRERFARLQVVADAIDFLKST